MNIRSLLSAFSLSIIVALAACTPMPSGETTHKPLSIEYEKYILGNGLEVILHEDHSDPIVAVAIQLHVGSNREKAGRTGFAHLFEHMLFQESENIGQDQFFKNIQSAGGTLNGWTWYDETVYYEVVPNNALELVLWMESDRMGYLLGKVTEEAFANQQDVVQNEKRQSYDNRPYGHTTYVIGKTLYPEGHPYNWQTIGDLEDLRNATLDDVKEFYKKWYGPNNATLVIAGDIDKTSTKALVERYFGEIPAADPVDKPVAISAGLMEEKRVFHEDNFATSPELNMVFPTINKRHADMYALDILSSLLSDGKNSPMYKVIVEETELAPSASTSSASFEVAGTFRFSVRAFPDTKLDDVVDAISKSLQKFEEDGFDDSDLNRIKAKLETSFYNGISSILNRAFNLAQYNEYYDSPAYMAEDIERSLSVTTDDVWRVYNTYIKDKPYVMTSFVPKGQGELVATGSTRFPIVEEEIKPDAEKAEIVADTKPFVKTPSKIDRSVRPPAGTDPKVIIPTIWENSFSNGLRVMGIEHNELPLIQFSLTIPGGMLLDDPDKIGVANLITDMLMEGTKNRTPQELEKAIDQLGASISMSTSADGITIRATTLRSKFEATFALFQEIMLEPRWDADAFALAKSRTIEGINRSQSNPAAVASRTFNKLVYGPDNILSNSTLGSKESVASINLDDLIEFYGANFSPSDAYLSVVGDITQKEATATFGTLESTWHAKNVMLPDLPALPAIEKSILYFVDVPGAKQSQIRVGRGAMAYTDPDFYPAYTMNMKLGGNFNGNLNMILREEKGYTYGARSGFSANKQAGHFVASSGVRSNVTFESVEIFRDEITKYRDGISDDDLQFTKDNLIKSNARRFETLGALLGTLNSIAKYDLPYDYVSQREDIVRNMTLAEHKALAQKYLLTDNMIYLVVGDAESQLDKLKELGFGDPILLEVD